MWQGARAVVQLCFWKLQVKFSVRGAGQSSAVTGQCAQGMSGSQVSEMSWSQAGAQHSKHCSRFCKSFAKPHVCMNVQQAEGCGHCQCSAESSGAQLLFSVQAAAV